MQQITKNTDENLSLKPKSKPSPFTPEYLIEGLFPTEEVHLIAGSSGAGKTTWTFQMIDSWSKGENVMGRFKSHPKEFVYIACDRSSKNLYTTQERCQVNFPVLSLPEIPFDNPSSTTYRRLIPRLLKDNPEARVFFIDGLATVLPEGSNVNDYNNISKFLIYMLQQCLQNHVTIFGIVHSTKVKEDSKFLHPRESILGSVAWAAFSETIATIENNEKTSIKTLRVMPRNNRDLVLEYKMDTNGRLVLASEDLSVGFLMDTFFMQRAGKEFSVGEAELFARDRDINRAELQVQLEQAQRSGMIASVRSNHFRVSPTPGALELSN